MGVLGLWKLLEGCAETVTFESLEGVVIAVDMSFWLNEALRVSASTGATGHKVALRILFHRVCKLIHYGIKPIFVFDGKPPDLKRRTLEKRAEGRRKVMKKLQDSRKSLLRNYLKSQLVRSRKGKSVMGTETGPGSSHSAVDAGTRGRQGGLNAQTFSADSIDSAVSSAEQAGASVVFPDEDTQKLLSVDDIPQNSEDFAKFQMERLLSRHKAFKAKEAVLKPYASETHASTSTVSGVTIRSLVAKSDNSLHCILVKDNISGVHGRDELRDNHVSVDEKPSNLSSVDSSELFPDPSPSSDRSCERKIVAKSNVNVSGENETASSDEIDEEDGESSSLVLMPTGNTDKSDDKVLQMDSKGNGEENHVYLDEQDIRQTGVMVQYRRDEQCIDQTSCDSSSSDEDFIDVSDQGSGRSSSPVAVPGHVITHLSPAARTLEVVASHGSESAAGDENEENVVSLDNVSDSECHADATTVDSELPASEEQLTQEEIDVLLADDGEARLSAERVYLLLQQEKWTRLAGSVTEQMLNDTQELLRLFGIPFITAPAEAEAQCCHLQKSGLCQAVLSDDSDCWLFGASCVYRSFFSKAVGAAVSNPMDLPVRYRSSVIRDVLGLDVAGLVCLGLVTGSDYSAGLHGAGVVTALEILAEFSSESQPEPLQALVAFGEWLHEYKTTGARGDTWNSTREKLAKLDLPPEFPFLDAWDAYHEPTVEYFLSDPSAFHWARPDLGPLREFSHLKIAGYEDRDRFDQAIKPLMKRFEERERQAHGGLERFFKRRSAVQRKRTGKSDVGVALKSKRLRRAVQKMKEKKLASTVTDD